MNTPVTAPPSRATGWSHFDNTARDHDLERACPEGVEVRLVSRQILGLGLLNALGAFSAAESPEHLFRNIDVLKIPFHRVNETLKYT
jgi:hypothetical protein